MPSYRTTRQHAPKGKPWHARRKRDGIEHHLGYYATEEEAREREAAFDRSWPSSKGRPKY